MFERWLEGITRRLYPHFMSVHQLMDLNDEKLWDLRECTEDSYNEWDRICRRYPVVNVWAIYQLHSSVGLRAMPSSWLTDEGVLSSAGKLTPLDTYRKLVDSAPDICRLAREELEEFWGIHPKRSST